MPRSLSTGIEPLTLGKYKRLRVTVDAASGASTADANIKVHVDGADNLSNLWTGNLSNLGDLFKKLGFEPAFHYSPPRSLNP